MKKHSVRILLSLAVIILMAMASVVLYACSDDPANRKTITFRDTMPDSIIYNQLFDVGPYLVLPENEVAVIAAEYVGATDRILVAGTTFTPKKYNCTIKITASLLSDASVFTEKEVAVKEAPPNIIPANTVYEKVGYRLDFDQIKTLVSIGSASDPVITVSKVASPGDELEITDQTYYVFEELGEYTVFFSVANTGGSVDGTLKLVIESVYSDKAIVRGTENYEITGPIPNGNHVEMWSNSSLSITEAPYFCAEGQYENEFFKFTTVYPTTAASDAEDTHLAFGVRVNDHNVGCRGSGIFIYLKGYEEASGNFEIQISYPGSFWFQTAKTDFKKIEGELLQKGQEYTFVIGAVNVADGSIDLYCLIYEDAACQELLYPLAYNIKGESSVVSSIQKGAFTVYSNATETSKFNMSYEVLEEFDVDSIFTLTPNTEKTIVEIGSTVVLAELIEKVNFVGPESVVFSVESVKIGDEVTDLNAVEEFTFNDYGLYEFSFTLSYADKVLTGTLLYEVPVEKEFCGDNEAVSIGAISCIDATVNNNTGYNYVLDQNSLKFEFNSLIGVNISVAYTENWDGKDEIYIPIMIEPLLSAAYGIQVAIGYQNGNWHDFGNGAWNYIQDDSDWVIFKFSIEEFKAMVGNNWDGTISFMFEPIWGASNGVLYVGGIYHRDIEGQESSERVFPITYKIKDTAAVWSVNEDPTKNYSDAVQTLRFSYEGDGVGINFYNDDGSSPNLEGIDKIYIMIMYEPSENPGENVYPRFNFGYYTGTETKYLTYKDVNANDPSYFITWFKLEISVSEMNGFDRMLQLYVTGDPGCTWYIGGIFYTSEAADGK